MYTYCMNIKRTPTFCFLSTFFLFCGLALVTFSPHISSAAETVSDQHILTPVNFTDYYHYGSVVAEINAQTPLISAGTPLTFKINVKNNNDYPIADGRLYIKIFRQQATTTANGPYVVESTFLPNVLTIKAGETVSLPYVWQTPANAVSGNYRISTYVIAGKDTNLSGLPFMDDITGSTYDFSVRGTNETVQFDKNNVFLNGYKYYFATFPPIVDSKVPIVIKAPITNTTKNVAVVKVTWKTYYWSQIDSDGTGLIGTKEANYTVLPNQKNEISYTVNDINKSVYYVEGTLTNGETKSIIGLRFARVSNDSLRVNFSTPLSYPLKSGVPAFIFTSVHNTADWSIPNVKTVLTVKDGNGNSVYDSSYTGDVSGNILGLKDSFTPKKDYTSFSLETKVYDGDKLVETISTKYDCAAFGEPCPQNDHTQILLILSGVIIVLIIVGGFIYKKKS